MLFNLSSKYHTPVGIRKIFINGQKSFSSVSFYIYVDDFAFLLREMMYS